METNIKNGEEKCKIRKVMVASSLINPVIVNIDNKFLTEEELNDYDCRWFEDASNKSSRFIKCSYLEKANYEGCSKISGNICKTMLVLQNKKNNKVRLMELGSCRLSRTLAQQSLQTNYDNDDIQSTYEDNRIKLLKAFGSKRSKRASDIGVKMRINTEIMSSQIKLSAADVSVDLRELELADCAVDTCMPPCHRDATDPTGVYLIEDFLSQQELQSMDDEAFAVLHLMPFTTEESGYSQFFIDALDRLQNKVNTDKIKILLYVESLLNFINLQLEKWKIRYILEKICPFSGLIAKKIVENFSVEGGVKRTRNETMDDKVVIHIIVLVIMACNFSCNTDELLKYLPSFSVVKIGQIARALSLTSRDKINWVLKLPLPPQRSKFIRRRRT